MQSLKIVKTERYDVNAMENLLCADQVSEADKKRLRAYKRLRTNGNEVQIVYEYGKQFKGAAYSRIYPQKGLGLQAFPGAIRACLAQKYYWDVDMENAQPTILLQMSKASGWVCDRLEDYILHRSERLAEVQEVMGCDRSDAKTMFISVLFGGHPIESAPSFVKELAHEMTVIQRNIVANADPTLKKILKREGKDDASLVAHVLQDREAKIFQEADTFLFGKGRVVGVNIHDGGLVERLPNEEVFPADLLREIGEHIHQKMGYQLTFSVKPLVHTFQFRASDHLTYEALKARFEETHFYHESTNAVVRINADHSYSYFDLRHATVALGELKFMDDGRERTLVDEWKYDPTKRTVRRFVAKMPEDCAADELSLFRGFAYPRMALPTDDQRREAVTLFQDLLLAICGDEEAAFHHTERIMAHLIQRPLQKTNVHVSFASPIEGSGKDSVMGILKAVIGTHHTAHYTDTEMFWEKHDSQREGAILVYLEEACCHLNKARDGPFKARITADEILINLKGLKPYTVPNLGTMFSTTNEGQANGISVHDRRTFIMSPTGRNVKLDWAHLHHHILHKEWFLRAIGEHLETLDLGESWNPTAFPTSQVKQELMKLAKSSETLFFEQWVSTEWVSASELFRLYRMFCTEESLPHCLNTISFCKRIVRMVGVDFQRRLLDGKNIYASLEAPEK